ncbi:hypothetical protein B0H12DRAFT_1083251 [Mycena haematopus]|nr:hypothetical protein B0H12DRAFT_1083251 [Mycena haematopus]
MDARSLFWVAIRSMPIGIAVVYYVTNHTPPFLREASMPFPGNLSPFCSLPPEALQCIFEHLSLEDLINVGHTSRRNQAVSSMVFKLSVSDILKPFSLSYSVIRFLQLATGLALSGSAITRLALYSRDAPDAFSPGDLDFYVPAVFWNSVGEFFDLATTYATVNVNNSLYCSVPSITAIALLENEHDKGRTLNLMRCMDSNVYGPPTQFHSSCVMGCITADRAWFPTLRLTTRRISILNETTLRLHTNHDLASALTFIRKYQDRGFRFHVDYPYPHDCGKHIDCPATLRTSVDKGCFVMRLPLLSSAPTHDHPAHIVSWSLGGQGCRSSSMRAWDFPRIVWRRQAQSAYRVYDITAIPPPAAPRSIKRPCARPPRRHRHGVAATQIGSFGTAAGMMPILPVKTPLIAEFQPLLSYFQPRRPPNTIKTSGSYDIECNYTGRDTSGAVQKIRLSSDRGPSRSAFTKHKEFASFEKCGGIEGMKAIIEGVLTDLGVPVVISQDSFRCIGRILVTNHGIPRLELQMPGVRYHVVFHPTPCMTNWNIQVLYATHNTNNTLQSTCGFGVLIQYRLWQFGLSSCTRKRLERQESGFYNNMVVVEGFWRNTPQERLSFKSKFRANIIRE